MHSLSNSYLGRLNVGRGETDEGLSVGAEVAAIPTPHQTCKRKREKVVGLGKLSLVKSPIVDSCEVLRGTREDSDVSVSSLSFE